MGHLLSLAQDTPELTFVNSWLRAIGDRGRRLRNPVPDARRGAGRDDEDRAASTHLVHHTSVMDPWVHHNGSRPDRVLGNDPEQGRNGPGHPAQRDDRRDPGDPDDDPEPVQLLGQGGDERCADAGQ